MGYIVSGFADEYSENFDEQLKGFNKLGIKYIELRFIDGINVADLTDEKLKEVREKLALADIKVSAIGSPIGKTDIREDFALCLEKAERVFFIAKELACKYVRVFSFYLKGEDRKDCEDEVVRRLNVLSDVAERYGVTLCHENEANIFGEDPDSCLLILKRLNGKVRCVFDMGNFRIGGYEPRKAYQKLKDYIEYFHIKDALIGGRIVPCGEGDAKIEEILKDYESERQVFISLEPHLTAFTGLSDLSSQDLKQKYSFATPKEAFTYAAENAFKILKRI